VQKKRKTKMKKLMIAVAVVCACVAAKSATVNWASGALQTPTSATDGTLSGSKITSSSGYTVAMYAFESLSAISYDAGDLFKWYQADPTAKFKGLDAISGTVTMGTSSTTAAAKGVISEDAGTTVYAAVLFVLSDETSGEAKWYMENSASKATAKAAVNVSNLGLKVGGGSSTTATAWTAVPEPTSGLLMLLGMAGLALRRRRA
jgi:hypothetical protein